MEWKLDWKQASSTDKNGYSKENCRETIWDRIQNKNMICGITDITKWTIEKKGFEIKT